MSGRNNEDARVINELRNGDYDVIFGFMVEGLTMFQTITMSENNDVEAIIVASLITSGWLNADEQERVRLLVDDAEYISRLLSQVTARHNFLPPNRITPEMNTNISRIITNIGNWIQSHGDDENSSQSSASSSSRSNSINSRSDQGSYSGEEPDIEDVLAIGSDDDITENGSAFNTPVQSDDDNDVDSESSGDDDTTRYNAQGGKSKMTRKSKSSKTSKKSHKSRRARKSQRTKRGGKSKTSKKNKKQTKRRKH